MVQQGKEDFPIITNIQKYSIHDGPGIRTTVFFKGCPLSCIWCHNPETQDFRPELIRYEDKCKGCMSCVTVCPAGAVSQKDAMPVIDRNACIRCGACADVCLHSALELLARRETPRALAALLERDQVFYEESGGGVTLSGGEVMCQNIDYLEELCKYLDKKGISVFIDTCGQAPYENFKRLNPYIDGYLYDIKHMDSKEHKKYMGTGNERILENLCRLSQDKKKIHLRLPLISDVNDSREEIEAVAAFLTKEHIVPEKIYLLPYHDMGKDKYKRLQRDYEGLMLEAPSKEHMESIQEIFAQYGFVRSQIGG